MIQLCFHHYQNLLHHQNHSKSFFIVSWALYLCFLTDIILYFPLFPNSSCIFSTHVRNKMVKGYRQNQEHSLGRLINKSCQSPKYQKSYRPKGLASGVPMIWLKPSESWHTQYIKRALPMNCKMHGLFSSSYWFANFRPVWFVFLSLFHCQCE